MPQELNTLSLRLTGETEVLEQLDNIRVKVSRQSPMMETIELVRGTCVDLQTIII